MGEASLLMVGVSHRRAAVGLRERVAIAKADLAGCLQALRADRSVQECIIVSTCNRTEVYAIMQGAPAAGVRVLEAFLAQRAGMA
ncbi:MAG TPA: glutamyl-tRNA reductase, partial [Chloroflexota bacterium]